MRQLMHVLLTTLALLAMQSCSTTRNLPDKPVEIPRTVLCNEEAFIERKDYVMKDPPRSKNKKEADVKFRQWQAETIGKYPRLLKSYDILRECWEEYHSRGEK